MKKLLFFSLLAVSLIAGQYAKLKDGTIIILKDDGTWEKVESLPAGTTVSEPVSGKESGKHADQEAKKIDPMAEKIKNNLQGEWVSVDGKITYLFEGDMLTFTEGRRKRSTKYNIENIDPKTLEFRVNAGERGTAGFFSFGGFVRNLAFSKDFQTLTDKTGIPVTLQKVK